MGAPLPDSTADAPDAETTSGGVPIKLLVFALLVGALFAATRLFDLEAGIESVRVFIEGLGVWGPLAFIGLYILAVLLMIPGSIPTIMAGGLFGALWGTVYVSIASTIGAALAFLIARYVARDTVGAWLQSKPRMAKLDRLSLKHGALLVGLTRLVPLFPFNLVNYGFGLTRVSFWPYVLVSWLCMLPGTFLYVAGTDVVVESVCTGDVPWILVAALVLVFIGLLWFGRHAMKTIFRDEDLASESAAGGEA